MSYIPKNRVQTNLYTNGNEYILASTLENYVGFYHKLFNGNVFTKKNPTEVPNELLIKVTNKEEKKNVLETRKSLNSEAINYNRIKSVNQGATKLIPTQYYPQPTEDDYKLGTFQRYFAYVINTIEYVEVNKDTFTKLQSKDSSWDWTRYNTFSLPWDIAGEEESVYHTNRNITLLTERRLKINGLQTFLRNNYLKFYKG